MKKTKISVLSLFLVFFVSNFLLSQNIDNSICWEASTNYKTSGFTNRFYKIEIDNEYIKISINREFNYVYKIFYGKKNKYFFMDREKYVIENRDDTHLKIIYKNKKLRESVNEIIMLDFKKCLNPLDTSRSRRNDAK